MKTSVIIPVRNRPDCLHWTLSSLARQNAVRDGLEVIVVDDGSTDHTPSVAASFQDRLALRVLTNTTNRGRSFSRNRGAEAAAGEHLVFLDADSYTHPDLVAGHQRWHDAFPDSVIIGRRIEAGWWTMRQLIEGAAVPEPLPFEGDQRDFIGLSEPERTAYERTPWLFVATHNLSLPADVFRKVGGFDENFVRWGYEDTEFGYRVFRYFGRQAGHFQYDPDLVCYHLPHFRDWPGEWEGTKAAQQYIKDKHRHFDVEMLIYPPNPARIAQTLPYYESCIDYLRTVENEATVEAARSHLDPVGRGQLWIGAGAAPLTGRGGNVRTCDHAQPESVDNHHLLGMHLPYEDRSFAAVVNVDLWRILDTVDLSSFVMEARRVADTVYLAMSKRATGDDARQIGLVSDPTYVVSMLSGRFPIEICQDDDDVVLLRSGDSR